MSSEIGIQIRMNAQSYWLLVKGEVEVIPLDADSVCDPRPRENAIQLIQVIAKIPELNMHYHAVTPGGASLHTMNGRLAMINPKPYYDQGKQPEALS